MICVVVFLAYWLCCRKKDKVIHDQVIPLSKHEDKQPMVMQSLASLQSSRSSSRQGVATPMLWVDTPMDGDEISVHLDSRVTASPTLLAQSLNTPRRTPEVAVTSLPPGFTEGQEEELLEDRRTMSLMARNDSDGTFIKLAMLQVNLVGTVFELRQEVTTALNETSNPLWKDQKFVLMRETLKDIADYQEEKLTVSEVYACECVLIRSEDGWDSATIDQDHSSSNSNSSGQEKPQPKPWAAQW